MSTNETFAGKRFFKMHGLGNDFVIFVVADAGEAEALFMTTVGKLKSLAPPEFYSIHEERVRKIAKRKTGLGCDQMVFLFSSSESSQTSAATAFVRFFNADGSEPESCGNAMRCIALLLLRVLPAMTTENVTSSSRTMNTSKELIITTLLDGNHFPCRVVSDCDPFLAPCVTVSVDLKVKVALNVADIEGGWSCSAANVGNPHAVFVDLKNDENTSDNLLNAVADQARGRLDLFPEGANVSVIREISSSLPSEEVSRCVYRMRVNERGAGITEACGTGATACAGVVFLMMKEARVRSIEMLMDGGALTFTDFRRAQQQQEDGSLFETVHLTMHGPASLVAHGRTVL